METFYGQRCSIPQKTSADAQKTSRYQPLIDKPLQHALKRATSLMNRCEIQGAFCGGLAVIIWGRPRATQDLDLIADIQPNMTENFLRAADDEGLIYDPEDATSLTEGGGFIRMLPRQKSEMLIPIDILVADTPLHLEAIKRSKRLKFGEIGINIISSEDLLLMKLVAFRPKDTFDLETVIDAVGPKLDLNYLRQWADTLGLRSRLETFLAGE